MPLVQLFRLLIFYELGSFDLLDSELRRVASFSKREKAYPKFTGSLIAAIKEAMNAKNNKDRRETFAVFKVSLHSLRDSGEDAAAFGQFHWIEWAESKAENSSLQIAIKNQLKLDLASA